MRNTRGECGETRSSALWGTGSRGGDSRGNALWGKGGRGLVTAVLAMLAIAAPIASSAGNSKRPNASVAKRTFVSSALLRNAQRHPNKLVRVIVQSRNGSVAQAASAFRRVDSLDGALGDQEVQNRRLGTIDAVAITVRADKLADLAKQPNLIVTEDGLMQASSYSSNQLWPYVATVSRNWGSNSTTQPTIAIVDSGIANRTDFGNRVLARVNLSTLPNNAPGDSRGHGTLVAGIAADSTNGYAGADPDAKLVSLDVMDDTGVARTSDVIAACQWILANKDTYKIRVANFSLHSVTPSNFATDPLDQAVEKLWFSGVVVVAAAGNYGTPTGPSGVLYAPGNDPFVITVGAVDIAGTARKEDDANAPWSAYGSTYDGFAKPELGAPGRFMVGPVPMTSTLATERASNIVAPGYIQLSGTSFAAPAVAGAAAQVIADHPLFTPDQVKGALMVTAAPAGRAAPGSLGVGELQAGKATTINDPPNPNQALSQFVTPDPLGGSVPVFDAVSWTDAAKANASWDSASWSDASWSDVSWTDASWTDVSWTDASWSDVSWSDVSWEDAAARDTSASGRYILTPLEAQVLMSDPETAPDPANLPRGILPAPHHGQN